ncbi:hypothetical protein DL764_008876 [Monosporascus ibericus]|uniref:N-acetyltransferase domain-containing protein n=1 Tax=Monosporascus ibericus TaxID=155417 RepID=A0A4V1X950_9PEZI|nr:hypothetical protein DL764_008876 [Monosporascus ibericus]
MSGILAEGRVRVKTTLPARPLPPNAERPHIRTERLVIRSFTPDDLAGLHALRAQPEVMVYSSAGRVDRDEAETKARLEAELPPNDAANYDFVICLASTGEFLGTGGVRLGSGKDFFGWPELGYMLKREHWGRGFATEFVRAFLAAWWALPRCRVELAVDARSLDAGAPVGPGAEVPEQLSALVEAGNLGSKRVLGKLGFRQFAEWTQEDDREGSDGAESRLCGFSVSNPAR